MNPNPVVSIVVPVYNSGRYIESTLESIREQSFSAWECVVVDDGSTDHSLSICENYASEDPRFKVMTQENRGVSTARNVGLKVCVGKYVCFVDSDDWIEPDYLSALLDNAGNAELVVSGQIREIADGTVMLAPSETCCFELTERNAARFVELEERLLLYAPHEKLFVNSIIQENKLSFKEDCSYGEDLIFNYQYLYYVRTISQIDKALYHYRLEKGTLSTSFRSNAFEEDYGQWRILKSFYIERSIMCNDAEVYLAKRLWGIVYDGIFLFPKLKEPPKNYLKGILSIPEIDVLRKHQDVFNCARWIKFGIVNRMPVLFNLYFKLLQ